jgi:inhibitor of cysteine peptidase
MLITIDQNGGEAELGLGATCMIQLPENPTTGYRWQVHSAGAPVVAIEADDFEVGSQRVGAPGLRRWTVRAAQPGTAVIELRNRRSWETEAMSTFRITLQVR